ncbi:MAG: D-2-hydroxyacid dehydrogenase [Eubacteriales bacterium]|nr:D-2-hydroxyacid dehydrogenase [Eubacteriales bacterium]
MEIVILEANSLGADIDLTVFEKLGHVTVYGQSMAEDTPEKVKDADIIIVNKVPMNETTLKSAEHLKMIAITATGYNIIDKAYTDSRGIVVANVGGYSTDSVAQHTFALALYLVNQMAYYDDYVKSGEYVRSDIFCHFDKKIFELAGKTWGIIGLGAIGRKVAEIAKVFGCEVIYYSTTGRNQNQDYCSVDLDTLLAKSDILSIHAPLNAVTENLMKLENFRKMKKSAILINVARGPIVNEQDLVTALEEGLIAGAGLDVISAEPMKESNPLLKIQDSGKLVVTPHIAWATGEARQRLTDEVYLNIEAFLNGEKRNLIP